MVSFWKILNPGLFYARVLCSTPLAEYQNLLALRYFATVPKYTTLSLLTSDI